MVSQIAPNDAKNGFSIIFYIDLVVRKKINSKFFDEKNNFWKVKNYFSEKFQIL